MSEGLEQKKPTGKAKISWSSLAIGVGTIVCGIGMNPGVLLLFPISLGVAVANVAQKNENKVSLAIGTLLSFVGFLLFFVLVMKRGPF